MAGTESLHGNHVFFRASGSRSGHHELVHGYQCGDGDHWNDHADRFRGQLLPLPSVIPCREIMWPEVRKQLESIIKVAAIVVGAGLGMLMAGGFRL